MLPSGWRQRGGTYLAACVFYAAAFGQSPEGIACSAGLAPDAARELQAVAAGTVLHDMMRWGLR